MKYFKVTVELFKMKLAPKEGRIPDLSEIVELYQVYSILFWQFLDAHAYQLCGHHL